MPCPTRAGLAETRSALRQRRDRLAPAIMWLAALSAMLAADRVQQHCSSLSATIPATDALPHASRARAPRFTIGVSHTVTVSSHAPAVTWRASPCTTLTADRAQKRCSSLSATICLPPCATCEHHDGVRSALRERRVTRSDSLAPAAMCRSHLALRWRRIVCSSAVVACLPPSARRSARCNKGARSALRQWRVTRTVTALRLPP
jgi:hypothetical protein